MSRVLTNSIFGNNASRSLHQDLLSQSNMIDREFNDIRDKVFERDAKTNIKYNNQLNNLRSQQNIRQENSDIEANLLFRELEKFISKGQGNLQIDINMVQRAMSELDQNNSRFLNPSEIAKKNSYANLINARNQIQVKENHFLQQLQHFQDQYLLNQRQTFHKGQSIDENSKRESILKLKLMNEQIQTDKAKFQRDFNQIKKSTQQFTATSILTNVNDLGQLEFTMMQKKLSEDQKKLDYMKRNLDHTHLPRDPDEIIHNGPADNFLQEIKYIYDGAKISNRPTEKLEQLSRIREQLEDYNNKTRKGLPVKFSLPFRQESDEPQQENGQQANNRSTKLNDIEQLRKDYVQAGGTDPNFMLNLSNLETVLQKNNNNTSSTQNMSFESQRPRGLATNMPYLDNSFAMPRSHPINSSLSQPRSDVSTIRNNASSLPQDSLTKHPIYDFLPNTFKQALFDLENENKNLKNNPSSVFDKQRESQVATNKNGPNLESEEKMLNYLRLQESELVLMMSRMDPRSQQHSSALLKFNEIQNLKGTLEQTILDKKVMAAVDSQKEKDIRQQKSVVTLNSSEFHKLQSIQSRVAVNYSESEGFIVHWDYLSGLQLFYRVARISYGVFRKGNDMYTYKQTLDHQCSYESFRSNKAMILERELFRDVEAFPDSYMFLEAWVYKDENTSPEVWGWSILNLFDEDSKLLIGSQTFTPNLLFTQPLPYTGNQLLYMRICLVGDPILDSNDNVLIENEYQMPEMHIHSSSQTMQLANISQVYLRNKQDPDASLSLLEDLNDKKYKDLNAKTSKTQTQTRIPPPSQDQPRRGLTKLGTRTPQSKQLITDSADSIYIIFRLTKIAHLITEDYRNMKLKLGIFMNDKILIDANDNQQVSMMPIEPHETEPIYFTFKEQHQFSMPIQSIIMKFDGEQLKNAYLFIGFFKNEKSLFGWHATPVFEQDSVSAQFLIRSGAYVENIFMPPGQSPPFEFGKIKKSNMEVNFIIMSSIQKPNQLEIRDNYIAVEGGQTIGIKKKQKKEIKNPKWNKEIHLDFKSLKNFPNSTKTMLRVALLASGELIQDVFDNPCLIQDSIPTFSTNDAKVQSCNYTVVFRCGTTYLRELFNKDINQIVLFFSFFQGEEIMGIVQWPLFNKKGDAIQTGVQTLPLYSLDKEGKQGSRTKLEINFEIFEDSLKLDNVDPNQHDVVEEYSLIPKGLPQDFGKKMIIVLKSLQGVAENIHLKYTISIYRKNEIIPDNYKNLCLKSGSVSNNPKKAVLQIEEQAIFQIPLIAISNVPYSKEFALLIELFNDDKEFAFFSQDLIVEGQINQGTFNQQLLKPPIQKCPVDFRSVKKSAVKIEFTINYTDKGLKQEIKQNTIKKADKNVENSASFLAILLHQLTGLEEDGVYYMRMALMWRDSFIKDRLEKPCALTSDKVQSQNKNLDLNGDLYEFDLDHNYLKVTYNEKMNEILCIIYVMNASDQPINWFFFPVFLDREKNVGRNYCCEFLLGLWVKQLYDKPIQRPPIDPKKAKEARQQIKFEIK